MDVDWVTIPAGPVWRGTPSADVPAVWERHADLEIRRDWLLKECPRAEIFVPAFHISRTPVTVGQWALFAHATGRPVPTGRPDHPVTGVRWSEAVTFCRWLGGSVRLPAESEWERAARGDDAREYPWGNTYRTGLANLRDLGVDSTLPVGSLPAGASPFGVLDLAGNCDEWLATEYRPYPGAPADVPQVDRFAVDPHLTRGGAWFHDRDLARCARRHGAYDAALTGIGFRLAADVPV